MRRQRGSSCRCPESDPPAGLQQRQWGSRHAACMRLGRPCVCVCTHSPRTTAHPGPALPALQQRCVVGSPARPSATNLLAFCCGQNPAGALFFAGDHHPLLDCPCQHITSSSHTHIRGTQLQSCSTAADLCGLAAAQRQTAERNCQIPRRAHTSAAASAWGLEIWEIVARMRSWQWGPTDAVLDCRLCCSVLELTLDASGRTRAK